MKMLITIFVLIMGVQSFAQESKLKLEFQVKEVQGQRILTLEGAEAEALLNVLPTQETSPGSYDRKGEILCSMSPEPGVGLKYSCFMLAK